MLARKVSQLATLVLLSWSEISAATNIASETESFPLSFPKPTRGGLFNSRWLADRLHVSIGASFSSNFLDQEQKLGKLGGALGGGAAQQEFARFDATEKKIPNVNPAQNQGGCPEVPGVTLPSAMPLKGGGLLPPQIFSLQGLSCSIDKAEGNSLTLLGPEIQFNLRYDIFPWLTIGSGFQMAFVFPASYLLKVNYLGQSQDIKANGITDPTNGNAINSVGAFLSIDSTARLKYSASSLEIPVMFYLNAIRTEYAQLYVGIGLTYTMLSLTTNLSAVQSVAIQANNQSLSLANSTIHDVENVRRLNALAFSITIGARTAITERAYLYLELKWLKGGNVVTVTGTEKQPGVTYANETFGGVVLEEISTGSIPQVLRSDADASGARTVDGVVASYSARFMLGVGYML